MNKHVTNIAPGQRYSESWEVDYLCNRYGLSRSTATTLVESYGEDRAKMEYEADRLAAYEQIEKWGTHGRRGA